MIIELTHLDVVLTVGPHSVALAHMLSVTFIGS